jgi:hypothetical protein
MKASPEAAVKADQLDYSGRTAESAGLAFKSSAWVSVRSWLSPFRVSEDVWLSIPAPPTLFCCAAIVSRKILVHNSFRSAA